MQMPRLQSHILLNMHRGRGQTASTTIVAWRVTMIGGGVAHQIRQAEHGPP